MVPQPGWAIIEPEEKKTEGGLELPGTAQETMQRGKIVALSPKYLKDGQSVEVTTIAVGDRVVFKKYHDNDMELNGKKYKIVHVENIMCKLEEGEN